ncbi:MAG: hypothetical protein LBV72_19910 [Tannerella sp.]|jgi:hypothetical protein|nr:hypothetical protein [Tannerella sp.]
MNWKEIFETHQLDYSILDKYQEKQGIKLFADEEYFIVEKNWCKEYKLGFELLPVFTNDESDFVGIYTTGLLKGKIACVDHDNIDFAPRFRNLASFIDRVNNTPIDFDWHDLPLDSFDYPSKKERPKYEQDSDDKIIVECWNLITKKELASNGNYELIAETILNLTPHTDLEKVLCFLDDENNFVRNKAIWLIGVYHQYLPAKEKVKEVARKTQNTLLWKQCYDGEFEKEKPSIWKRIFG